MKKAEFWKKNLLKRNKPNTQAVTMLIEEQKGFGTEGCIGIAEALNSYNHLNKISLEIMSDECIGAQGTAALGKAIHSKQLTDLSLRFAGQNLLDDPGVESLLKCIGKLEDLNKLDLQFGGYLASSRIITQKQQAADVFISPQINFNRRLRCIILRRVNMLSQQNIRTFFGVWVPSKFPGFFQYLNSRKECFNLKGLNMLGKSLITCKTIKRLLFNIEINHTGGAKKKEENQLSGIDIVTQLLKSLTNLQILDLNLHCYYGMNKEGAIKLGQAFSEAPQLFGLKISIKEFANASQEGTIGLLQGIANCPKLLSLYFRIQYFNAGLSLSKFQRMLYKSSTLVTFQEMFPEGVGKEPMIMQQTNNSSLSMYDLPTKSNF